MKVFAVGELYKSGITKYNEGARFDFTQSGAVLELYFKSPTINEVQEIKNGCFKTGFVEFAGVIFMLFKFGNLNWIDAPYSVHLSKPFEFEEPTRGSGYGLNIFFIDANTGILKNIRYIGLSTEFSLSFKNAVLKQRKAEFNNNYYSAALQNIYLKYTTNDLVKLSNIFFFI